MKNVVKRGDIPFQIILYILMALLVFATLYPFWYVIVCSVSTIGHIMSGGFLFWPDGLNLQAYAQVFAKDLVPIAYRNTLFIVTVGTLLSMLLTTLGAFSLSRKTLPGRKYLTMFVVLTMLFSGGLIPFYLTVRGVGLLESIWSLIIPTCMSTYNMIILRNFFQSVPDSLYESTCIDGARLSGYLWWILLPLSMPAMATITLFYAVGYWNAYFNSMIFIQNRALRPMQAILREALMANINAMLYDDSLFDVPSETLKNAMIVVTALPIICVYPFLQRYFVKGVMVGALKG